MKGPWITILAASLATVGCAARRPVPANVRVPPEILRGAPYTAGGETPRARYVVRMTDGERDWEIQLPEIATAYEVKVPLRGAPPSPVAVDLARLTAADREILQERSMQRAADGRDPKRDGRAGDDEDDGESEAGAKPAAAKGPAGRAVAAAEAGGKAAAPKGSYLLTLAKVKELYRTRHYELALIELVELERQYPDDERILSMKGSLYERMGNKALARQAWQQALNINPYNLAILEALQRLGK